MKKVFNARWLMAAALLIAMIVPQMARADVAETKVAKADAVHATCDHTFASTDTYHALCTKCNHGFFRYKTLNEQEKEYVSPAHPENIKGEMGKNLNLVSHEYSVGSDHIGVGVIEFDGPIVEIGESAFEGKHFSYDLVIPYTVDRIGVAAFKNCTYFSKTDKLILPDNLLLIGESAFQGATMGGALVIPDHVQSIGKNAFRACKQFTSLTLGTGLHYIKEGAFAECYFGGTLTIPNNIEELGDYCFKSCDFTALNLNTSGCTKIGNYAFLDCAKLTGSLTIPYCVQEIGAGAFKGCTGLSGNLSFDTNLKTIGASAFQGCSNLKTVNGETYNGMTINGVSHVETIGESAFEGCSSLAGTMELYYRVQTVGSRAFYGCSKITQLIIGDKCESIGANAFQGCSSLKSFGSCNNLKDIGNYAFYNCKALSSANFGDKLETIGKSAFENCTSLSGNLTFPNTLKSIGEEAFRECTSLNGTLTLGTSLESIGAYAFYDCEKLSGTLTLPSTLKAIGSGAFSYVKGFTAIYNYALQPQTITANVFSVYKSVPLYVTGSSVTAYKAAENWSEFKVISCIPDTHEFTAKFPGDAYLKDSGTCRGEVYYLKCAYCDAHGEDTWVDETAPKGNHNFVTNNDGELECSVCGHPAIEFATPEMDMAMGFIGIVEAFIIDDPYRLALFRDYVNDNHKSTNAVLLNDIDMSSLCHPASDVASAVSWEPIANWSGTFYGLGHKITNLYINNPSGSGAFILNAERGQFKDFTLQGTVSGASNMALLVSNANNCYFEKVITSGRVVATGECAAGMVAYEEGSATVDNCFNEASIKASHAVGGLYGTILESANISNSGNAGAIEATYSGTDVYDVGGIVGSAEGIFLYNSYAAGTMTWPNHTPGMLLGTANGMAECGSSYYLEGTSPYCKKPRDFKANTVTASELANGSFAYRLQCTNSNNVWGQDLANQKAYPVPGAPRVYPSESRCDGQISANVTYSNTPGIVSDHNMVNGICTVCGEADLNIIVPASGSISRTIIDNNTYTLLDDGGAEGNYSNNAKGTVHLTAPEGKALRFDGQFYGDSNDVLTIGGESFTPSPNGKRVLCLATNTKTDVKFVSDSSENGQGFNIKVEPIIFLTNITAEVTPNEDGKTSNVTFKYDNVYALWESYVIIERDKNGDDQILAEITDELNTNSVTLEGVSQGKHSYLISTYFRNSGFYLPVDATLHVHNFVDGLCVDCGACEAFITTGNHDFVDNEAGSHYCRFCQARPEVFILKYVNENIELEEGFMKRLTVEGVAESEQPLSLYAVDSEDESTTFYYPVDADVHAPFAKTALADNGMHGMYIVNGDYEVTVNHEGNLVYLTINEHKVAKGDFNDNGQVSSYDLVELIHSFNSGDLKYDMDGDGDVDQKDADRVVAIILENPRYGYGEGFLATKVDFQDADLPFQFWHANDNIAIVSNGVYTSYSFAGSNNASATGFYPTNDYAPDTYLAVSPYQETYTVETGSGSSGSVLTDEDLMALRQAMMLSQEDYYNGLMILESYCDQIYEQDPEHGFERANMLFAAYDEYYRSGEMPDLNGGGSSSQTYPTYSDGTIQGYKIPTTQNINAEGYDPAACIMLAEGNDNKDLQFKAVVSYIKVNITSSDVTSFRLTAQEGYPISGAIDISMYDGTPCLELHEGLETFEYVNVNITAGTKVVYVAVMQNPMNFSISGNGRQEDYDAVSLAPGQVAEVTF